MQAKVRINITTIPGRCFFWLLHYKSEIFVTFSLILFFICKSSLIANNKLTDVVISYIITPSANIIASPITITKSTLDYASKATYIYKENKILRSNNDLLRQIILQNEKYAKESKQLKELLNFKEHNNFHTTTSRIYVTNTGSYRQTAIIKIGSNENAKKNQVVISGNGLLGRIIETFSHSAQILLYTDPKSRIPVYSSDSREKAIMIGQNNKLPRLQYLTKNNSLSVGEIIYTSGDGMVFPPDIPVGIVIKDTEGDFVIKPFVNIEKVEFISIIDVTNEN